jgi:hypothetical protein
MALFIVGAQPIEGAIVKKIQSGTKVARFNMSDLPVCKYQALRWLSPILPLPVTANSLSLSFYTLSLTSTDPNFFSPKYKVNGPVMQFGCVGFAA